jgi:DNA-binding beta-propeller fold protein YncE
MLFAGRAVRVGALLAAALAATGLPPVAGPGAASVRPASTIAPVTLSGAVQGVAVDSSTDTAYVTALTASQTQSESVYAVDLATGTVIATIPVGRLARAIAVNPVTDTVYAASYRDATVSVISGATDTVTATIALPAPAGDFGDMAVDATTNAIYISGGDSGSLGKGVVVLNGATNSVSFIALSDCEDPPVGLAIDPATSTVYTNCDGYDLSNHIFAINGATGTVTIDVAEKYQIAGQVTVDPNTNLLYISRTGTGTGEGVTAYDGTTLAPVGEVSLPGNPTSLEDNPDTGTVYAAFASLTAGQNVIDLINGASTAVTGTIPVSGSGWIAVEPAVDTLVYAANGNPGVAVSVIPLTTPAISSRDAATFSTDIAVSFTVGGTGTPAPSFTEKGRLPYDVSMYPDGTLCCMPVAGTGGVYPITITAANGVAPAATQRFTLTVDEPPTIISANHFWFTHGKRGTFTVRTTAFPVAIMTEHGTLPPGVRFTANKNGTATISGVAAKAARGRSYLIRLTARNGVGASATQWFTLRVG